MIRRETSLGEGANVQDTEQTVPSFATLKNQYPYDYYEVISTVAAEDAWRPVAESACSLLKTQ